MNTASFDLRFTIPLNATGFRLKFQNFIATEPYIGELSDYINLNFVLEGAYSNIQLGLGDGPVVLDQQYFPLGGAVDPQAFRVTAFNTLLVVFLNDQPVFTYTFRAISKLSSATVTAEITSDDPATLTDILAVEIADGREAVFADYELSTEAAIQAIIQQRPVRVIPRAEPNTISFTYSATGDHVDAIFLKEITQNSTDGDDLSSDGIVYYSDILGISDPWVAENFGFMTRLYRLPELDDVTRAVQAIQERSREMTEMTNLRQRFDPRIEALDVVDYDMYITGTLRHLLGSVIVENISCNLQDAGQSMNVGGREDQ